MISNELQFLKEKYERIKVQLIQKLSDMETIQGTLRISVNGKKIRYYHHWEHDGRMDDGDYARKAVRKIEVYENNSIYIGERLIVTFETSEKILGTREIERIIHRFLV